MDMQQRAIYLLSLLFLMVTGCEKTAPTGGDHQLPADLANSATEQQAAEFAWKTFIAINWPASDENGVPDLEKPFGSPGPTVWESWKEVFDLFENPSQAPVWEAGNKLPVGCDGRTARKALHQSTKVSDLLDERDQAVGGAMVDVAGNIARYEVRINRPMFDFIVDNGLYNKEGQGTFPQDKFTFPNGSIELKGAWKKIEFGQDDPGRYHLAHTLIYDKGIGDTTVNTDCLPESVRNKMVACDTATMGLVGLHVVYRVPSAPSSVWMTFEQIDNTNDAPEGIRPSFYDPDCKDCPPNMRFCDDPDQEFTQVERVILDDPAIRESDSIYRIVNAQFQNSPLIKDTKWKHYKLVGIQYPTDPDFDKVGKPNRRQLANTTMETFNQSASSCVGCHAFARSSNPVFLSDFAWFMARAKSNPDFRLDANSTAEEIMYYVSYIKPYKLWRTWPDDQWNKFSGPMGGENPHGKSVRLFVNDIAYDAVFDAQGQRKPQQDGSLPPGSIILKENYRVPFPITPTPSDLVEITLMHKRKASENGKNNPLNWNWIKATQNGARIDNRGADESCFSCHSWQGNGDFMLLFNFGQEPVIQTQRIDSLMAREFVAEKQLTPEDVALMRNFLREQDSLQALMRRVSHPGGN